MQHGVRAVAIVVEGDPVLSVSPGILCDYDSNNALMVIAQYTTDPADPGSTTRWRRPRATPQTIYARNNYPSRISRVSSSGVLSIE